MKLSDALAPPLLTPRRAALLEQGALAGANFVAFLLFARMLSPAAWGEFGFAYALVLFLQGFQRAWVTLPMIAYSGGPAGWAGSHGRWAGANAALATGAALLLLLAASVAPLLTAPWLVRSLLMAALMALPVMVHEFVRRAAVQESRFDLVAAMGAVYAVVMAGTALAPVPATLQPWLPALAVGLGSGAAALLYRVVAGRAALPWPSRPPGYEGHRAFGCWAALGHLAYSGYNFGIQALLATVAGPAAVGAFHACRTLVQPVSTLMGALDSIDKPRAAAALAQGGAPALRRLLWRTLRCGATLALPYLVLVALAAAPLLEWAYGERYAGQQGVVWAWCAVALLMLAAQPVESGLYVARRVRSLFLCRAGAAVLSLALAVPAVSVWGVAGALAAMGAGFLLAAACGALALRRLVDPS